MTADLQEVPFAIDPPAGPGAIAPHLLATGEEVLLSWTEPVTGAEGGQRVRISRLKDGAWGEPATIAQGEDFFVNWADFPVLAAGPDGALYVHWLQKSGSGTYAYDVMLARSSDGGVTWVHLGSLHDDGTQTEHGFVSYVPEEGGVRAFWLDGREMARGEGHGHEPGSMTLRTAAVGDSAGPGTLLDARTCECCQTASALTSSGPLVVYRGRSEAEIRDIMIVRREAARWTSPVPVHPDGWEVPGCPVNGPAVVAAGERVVVAWFTAADNEPRVLAAFSDDGGLSFGVPLEVDTAGPLGRVDVALLPDGDAAVAWMAVQGDNAVIRLRRLSGSGVMGEPVDLASTSSSRGSGFPRMAAVEGGLLVAWTETGDPSRIRVTRAPFPPRPGKGEEARRAAAASPRGWDGKTGSLVPDYRVETLDGRPWSLAREAGEPYLLNLWATWCGPCRKEMPDLAILDREYAPRGLRVVGLSLDDPGDLEAVRSFVDRERIEYPVLLDVEGKATALFRVSSLPATFLFDSKGVLVWKSYLLVRPDDPDLREALERAIDS